MVNSSAGIKIRHSKKLGEKPITLKLTVVQSFHGIFSLIEREEDVPIQWLPVKNQSLESGTVQGAI